jgi:hypothetical protein
MFPLGGRRVADRFLFSCRHVTPVRATNEGANLHRHSSRFALPHRVIMLGLAAMGSKYVPSIKDLKAGQRFQNKQLVQSKFIKPAPAPKKPVKKTAKP